MGFKNILSFFVFWTDKAVRSVWAGFAHQFHPFSTQPRRSNSQVHSMAKLHRHIPSRLQPQQIRVVGSVAGLHLPLTAVTNPKVHIRQQVPQAEWGGGSDRESRSDFRVLYHPEKNI